MNAFIPFIDDDTNEPINEGFYVLVTINEVLSNPIDVANAQTIRGGISLVRILDDDSKNWCVFWILYEPGGAEALPLSVLASVLWDLLTELGYAVVIKL